MLDFSRLILADKPINLDFNRLIERTTPPSENTRHYLGASMIGSECLRRTQYDWWVDPEFPTRTLDIFERGHFHEALVRRRMIAAGFEFASNNRLHFTSASGLFRGHADGLLLRGPELPGLAYPALWEHKCVNAKSWRAIERDGLVGLYTVYLVQTVIYQAYLDVMNPALFVCTNADTCERLAFLVPFDAALAQSFSDRALAIIQSTMADELLPRFTNDPDDWRCKMCAHRKQCWG
jgi:hypothetical protein